MTLSELYDFWQRWAHRTDIVADMATIYAQTRQLIATSTMRAMTTEELDDILANAPTAYQYGGLIFIQSLAQDDDEEAKARATFGQTMEDYEIARSIASGPAIAKAL